MKIFSSEWANAYQLAINNNPQYAETSQNWKHGQLAMVLISSDNSPAVILDLDSGLCRDVQSVSTQEAQTQANFVIEGDRHAWEAVLNNDIQPLMAIMRGKLKLTKGSISKLMPFAKSAIELVNSAQTIETHFPD